MTMIISVIVPVYNAEKWLRECIDSILTQTYSNIELVLINDGSTDNSLAICQEYARKDDRVIVLDQENAGPSAARNNGIRNCNGDYLCFVDSDDWLEPDACEQLIKAVYDTNADMVVYGYNRVENGVKKLENVNVDPGLYETKEELKGLALNYIYSPISKKVKVFSWLRLIRKDIMINNNIWFNEDIYRGEDYLLFAQIHLHVSKVYSMTDKALYNYRYVDDSITNTYVKNMWDMALKTYEILKCSVHGKGKDYYERVNCMLIYRARLSIKNIMQSQMGFLYKIKELRKIVRSTQLQAALNMEKDNPLLYELKNHWRLMKCKSSLLVFLRYWIRKEN